MGLFRRDEEPAAPKSCAACRAKDDTIDILRTELTAMRQQLSAERESHSQTRKDLTHIADVRAGAIAHRKPRAAEEGEKTPGPKSPYEAMADTPVFPNNGPFRVGMPQEEVERILAERSSGVIPSVDKSES